MNNSEESEKARQAVLKAMFDLTNENRNPSEIHMPTRDQLARRAGVGKDEAAYALEYLTARGLVKPEELGDDGSPNYSITTHGIDKIESTPEVVEPSPRGERQPLVRDMDLVRELMVYISNHAMEHQFIPQPQVAEFSDELVSYHLSIMHQAGLMQGSIKGGGKWGLGPLTWEGQEFLSATSNGQAWNNVKRNLGGSFATLTFGIVKDLVVREIRNQFNLPS